MPRAASTGEQWHMLPQSYPNYKTIHGRFQAWCRDRFCGGSVPPIEQGQPGPRV